MFTKKVLTIELGEIYTRICEIDFRKINKPKIYQIVTLHTPNELLENGYIRDIAVLAEYLKDELKLAGIRNKNVVFTIASTSIVSREITIPTVKKEYISKIVQEQADDYLPVDTTDYIISYNVLEKLKEQKKQRLTIFAAPKELVQQYFDLAEAIGLKIESLDYSANSAFQFFKNKIKKETFMVLQISELATAVSIIDCGRLRLQRNLNWGSQFEQETSASEDTIKEEAEALISSILRVLEYYSHSENATPVSKLYLTGDGAFLPFLDRIISTEIELPVECLRGIDGVLFKEKNPDIESHRSHYINCVGAAFSPADFMPYELADYEQKKMNVRTYGVLLGIVAGLCIFITVINHSLYRSALNEQKNIKEQIQMKSGIMQTYDTYIKEKKEHDQLIALDATTKRNNESLNILLEELEDNLPSTSLITSMSSSGDTVSMSMAVPDKRTASKLLLVLQQFSFLEKTYISQLIEDKENAKVQFTVICTFSKEEETSKNE